MGETLKPELCKPSATHIPCDDLRWMEDEFAEYNRVLGYPEHFNGEACPAGRAVPQYECTRRYRHEQKPLKRLRKAISRSLAMLTHRNISRAVSSPR